MLLLHALSASAVFCTMIDRESETDKDKTNLSSLTLLLLDIFVTELPT